MKSRQKTLYILIPLLMALVFIGGMFSGRFFSQRESNHKQDKIRTIIGLINREYVDKIDTDSLLEETIPDLLSKLDPHTTYIPARELQGLNEGLDGFFEGIGVVFSVLNDTATIMEVVSGGSGERVGLIPGDKIMQINDSTVAGVNIRSEAIRSQLKGPAGTVVNVKVKRSTSPTLLSFDIERGEVPVTSIDAAYMIAPETGYVKVNKFAKNTYMEFMNAMVSLKMQGAERFIVDLRGNSGGYLEPAVLMANEFLPSGSPIVTTHGRTSMSENMMGSDGTGGFQNEELIVLIDEASASSSEIFSGAIQDNDRGLIVGRRSFGKGLIQNQIILPDSSAVRLTIARYYTPSGRSIQKPYTRGANDSYQMEIYDRISHGEGLYADSVKLDKSHVYLTLGGREVYGGGGIMPDVYVIGDTVGVTSYYLNVFNAGMLHNFALTYADTHREELGRAANVEELLAILPSDDAILNEFVNFSKVKGGIAPRWYYINISRDLIVNQLKSLIASDIIGQSALYEVSNLSDEVVKQALKEFEQGRATYPLTSKTES